MSEEALDSPHPIIPGLTASRRRTIQAAAPIIAVLATVYGFTNESTATLWVNLAMALVSTGVALPNVPDASPLRRWVYGLVLAVSALAVGLGVADGATAALWVSLAAVVISGGVAYGNTTDDVIATTGTAGPFTPRA